MERPAYFLVLSILLVALAAASPAYADVTVYVEEERMVFDRAATVASGSVMVPVTALERYLEGTLQWSVGDTTAVLEVYDRKLSFSADREEVVVNGSSHAIEPAPRMMDDYLMVPLRFVANELNLRLAYDTELGALQLSLPDREPKSTVRSILDLPEPEFEIAEKPEPEDAAEELGPVLERRQPSFRIAPLPKPEPEEEAEPETEPEKELPTFLVEDVDPTQPSWRDRLAIPPLRGQDLRAVEYKGGPRSNVHIDVDNYTRYQSVLLVEPDRLVVDIYGIQADPLPDKHIDGRLIERIRTSQFDDDTMRIVFDLHTSTGYEVRHRPDGGLDIEFNYHIYDVDVEWTNGQPRLNIASTDHPDYDIIQLREPRRIVLDFHNATLVGGAQEKSIERDGRINRLRVSQFIPSTTRVVLDLEGDVTPLAMEALDTGYALNLFEGSESDARIYQAQLAREARLQREESWDDDVDLPDHVPTSVRRQDAVLSDYVVAVDAGHGGSDPGAIGPRGTFEKDVALDISLFLGELLEDAGATVVYTRTDDVYVSIFERPEIASRNDADVLVSIHANSYIGNTARGTETLYHPKGSPNQLLAQSLQTELVEAVQLIDRGLRQRTDLALLNGSSIPTALVEVGFLNHPEEELLLRSRGFQQVAAEGLFNGVVRFLEILR